MDQKLIAQIREKLKQKSIDELCEIWKQNDKEQYSEEAFAVIKQLIVSRGSDLPIQQIAEENINGGYKKSNFSDDELIRIVTEDYSSYSHEEINGYVQELKNRDYNFDNDVLEEIEEYFRVADLSDDELIEIVTHRWNHPASLVESADKLLAQKGLEIDVADFDANTKRTKIITREGVMSEKEESGSSFITPGGAGIAAICFFMPWVKACGQSVSGAQMGGVFWVVFFAAVAIVGAFFFFRSQNEVEKTKPVAIIGSIISILILVVKYQEARKQLGGMIDFEIGAIGTVAGFAAAIIGVAFIESSKTNTARAYSSQRSQSSGPSYSAQTVAAAMTVCPNCSKAYDGDLKGQYCEECGTMIT